jgi:hypothetical protein
VESGHQRLYQEGMIALLAALLSSGACSGHPISLDQAKRLVLATPNIRASVSRSGAKPRFEWIEAERGGWHFDVNSATPCLRHNACSTLLGHFAVTRDGEVEDLDRGEDGVLVSSARMKRLIHAFHEGNCATPRRP